MSKAHDDQPFPIAEARRTQAQVDAKPKPQRPMLDLVPFSQKNPNDLLARLERRLTVAEDQLADAQRIITAQEQCIKDWEAWAGVTAEPAAPEPPAAD